VTVLHWLVISPGEKFAQASVCALWMLNFFVASRVLVCGFRVNYTGLRNSLLLTKVGVVLSNLYGKFSSGMLSGVM